MSEVPLYTGEDATRVRATRPSRSRKRRVHITNKKEQKWRQSGVPEEGGVRTVPGD